MKKIGFYITFSIMFLLLLAGCTPLTTINNKAVKDLRKDLMGITSSIETVKVTAWGPWAKIEIFFSDEPPQDTIDAVFERVKAFPIEGNLKSFNCELPDVHLYIYINGDKENPSVIYSTSYLNSNDYTDESPSNVNGYKTWTTWTSPPD